jgi:hypothetical protein
MSQTPSVDQDPERPVTLQYLAWAVADAREAITRNHDATIDSVNKLGARTEKIEIASNRIEERQITSEAKLMVELALVRGSLSRLEGRDSQHHEQIESVRRTAAQARAMAALRIGALMLSGAALWKAFEWLYPLLPR